MQIILDRLEAISKILLILGTLVGGAWAIFEYLEKKQDGRVAESLGYVRRLSSEPLLSAQARIAMAWYAARDSVRNLDSTPVSSADEFARRKRQLVMMVVDRTAIPLSSSAIQKGLVPDLDLLVDFFRELQVCIDANLCDRQTAVSFFKSYARRLYCLHEPFITWKSSSYSMGYGSELRGFALTDGATCS